MVVNNFWKFDYMHLRCLNRNLALQYDVEYIGFISEVLHKLLAGHSLDFEPPSELYKGTLSAKEGHDLWHSCDKEFFDSFIAESAIFFIFNSVKDFV